MTTSRPYCLTIAGFDPSGGAGVLADIKTFEAIKVNGLGVATGLTFQNDSEFEGVNWIETDDIGKQIEILSKKFKFEYVKIGMVKNLETLEKIIFYLSQLNSTAPPLKIVWDPILKASAGFDIDKTFNTEKLLDICKNIFLITPNIEEIRKLLNEKDDVKAAKELSQYCNVFLKGGHSENKKGGDYLFTIEGKIFPFRAKKISSFSKHGSGCVLSSAITAHLGKGENLLRACLKGKN